MNTTDPNITGNPILDEQAGGDRNDNDARTTEERSFQATPSRPDLDLADDTDTGQAIDGLDGDADDTSFRTSTIEANRSVEQGNGVGEMELEAQRDPNEAAGGSDTQLNLNARADASRDNHQTPRGNDAVRDTADNLGGGR